MALPDFTIYNRPDYLDDLIQRIGELGRGDRVTLMTMHYDARVERVRRLTETLAGAARRGATAELIVDAISFILGHGAAPGPLLYGRQPRAGSRGVYGMNYRQLEALRAAGGHYYIINQPRHALSNPYAGRSHIKLGLINGRVYIPSCNLDNDTDLDLVIGWDDDATAAWLRQLAASIAAAGNVRQALGGRDRRYDISPAMTLFTDSGVRRQSLIYQQALGLIDQAERHVYLTCQYFPGGTTAEHLLQAERRGAAVRTRFSPPAAHGSQRLGHAIYNLRQRRRWPASFFSGQLSASQPKLHAKLLATEQAVLTGSHNYVTSGVSLGTAELALLVRDPALSERLAARMEQAVSLAG